MLILGIETSCDETAASIVEDGKIIKSSVVSSQADLFAKYGEVVPEIASRKHLEFLTPVIEQALEEANVKLEDLDGIAYTKTPGLLPAPLVGISHAKALALSLGIPALPINHLEAYVYANSLMPLADDEEELPYPHICLLISRQHTDILFVTSPTEYEILGSTRDDAVGKVFYKVAQILDLLYPSTPVIEKIAKDGDEAAIKFPRPLINSDDYDFSFSELETAVLNETNRYKENEYGEDLDPEIRDELDANWKADVAASFQEAVAEVLVAKTLKAAIAKGVDTVTLAGGIAANSRIREKMIRAADELGIDVRYPEIKMCMDNAAMVAVLGYHALKDIN